jgi:hypothetical protein
MKKFEHKGRMIEVTFDYLHEVCIDGVLRGSGFAHAEDAARFARRLIDNTMTTQDKVTECLNHYDHERSLIQRLAEAERRSAALATEMHTKIEEALKHKFSTYQKALAAWFRFNSQV